MTYTPPTPSAGCGTLGTQQLLGTGSRPAVAATANGWVVAWQGGSQVKWATIGPTGKPSGSGQPVGSQAGQQSLPAIAAVSPSGGFAVTWIAPNSAGASAVFAQRFDATQSAVAGDQTASVNNLTTGAETSPSIAFATAAGGAYVVAWVDAASPNQVRARLLTATSGSLGDGTGYLLNTIDGTSNEFLVSITAGRARANPAVVVGGSVVGSSGPYIAFGWRTSRAPVCSPRPASSVEGSLPDSVKAPRARRWSRIGADLRADARQRGAPGVEHPKRPAMPEAGGSMRKKPEILHFETPDDARNFLGQLAADLIDQLQSIAHDEDDATKLDRASATVRKTAPEVTALVALSLFATVRDHEEKIATYDGLLRKLVAGPAGEAKA